MDMKFDWVKAESEWKVEASKKMKAEVDPHIKVTKQAI